MLALSLAACGEEDERSSIDTNASPPPAAAPEEEDTGQAGGGDAEKPEVEVPAEPADDLVKEDLKKGDGKTAKEGDTVSVHYVGVAQSTENEFDASYDRGEPFEFELGAGNVIEGWDEGVVGMKEGGRRRLVIPGDQAYGPQGQPPDIGPDETLVFVIDLLEVK